MGLFRDFGRALSQLGDRRFRRVLLLGVALSVALLVAVYAAFLWALQTWTPDEIEIPLVGPIGGLGTLLTLGSALFMIGLSIFLMAPVASAFAGLFVDDVVQAVEETHYPWLPPVAPASWGDTLKDTVNFVALVIAANVLGVLIWIVMGPLMPLGFWALNGFLLGREFFLLVATRRLGRQGARAMRGRHWGKVWVAGILMAAPLSIPLINLLIPVLGAATFTHMFHRLAAADQLPR